MHALETELKRYHCLNEAAAPDLPTAHPVQSLYRAGIVGGSDNFGTFYPESSLTRGAAAAILARIADPAQRLHLELMNALVKTNRNNEALMQYKHVTNLHFRYLGVKPPEGIQQFYKQIIQAGSSLEMNLDSMREELQEYGDVHGAFECEYAVFREIYNLQMRNLERFGTNMYLAMIMVSSMDGEPLDPLRLDDIMKGLAEILKERLRKGTVDLIHTLQKEGFEVWVYTSSFRSERYISRLFRHYGVRFDGIVNGTRHLNEVQRDSKTVLPQKMPSHYRISLHIDDESVICSMGPQYGFRAYQLDAQDDDWKEKIIARAEQVKKLTGK